MVELMLRTLIVGGFATIAACLFERGVAHLRIGTRFAWTFALLATVVLPFVPRLMQSSPVADVVPVLLTPGIVVSATSQIESRFPINPLVAAWLFLSTIVLITYLVSYVRLRRARQGWLPAQVARRDVYMSEGFGPAVFGFIAPQIVVPKWVCDAEREEQELIVLHESEHIRARDQWQLLLAICATIAMPWNPLVWIHTRRLRFAIEADCDQRVLAAAPDRARYASLLVNVGAKQNGLLLTPALAEHRNGLEARLNMLATKLKENRWKAAGMMAVGVVLTVVACESRLPQEATENAFITKLDDQPITQGGRVMVDDRVVVSSLREGAPRRGAPKVIMEKMSPMRMVPDEALRSLPRKVDPDGEPHFTPYSKKPELRNRERVEDLLKSNYPPALRDAGIGGTVLVWVLVDEDGRVINKKLRQTSGQETLDAAGLQVIQQMEFSPAEHEGKPVRVWIQMPVMFKTQ